MKLKTVEVDGKTYAAMQDGKPVYVHDDGKEVAFDAPATVQTISRLNGEAKGHREAKEAAEAKLRLFDGLDPAAAKDALDKIANLNGKKLIEAGEKDAAVAAAIKPWEEKFTAAEQRAAAAEKALHVEKIGGSFSRSKFIADKLVIPADLVEARFGSNFEMKDGKIVAKDPAGNPMYSRAKPGELAEFDEALEMLVDAYPQKAHILKGNNAGGGGKSPSDPPGMGGAKSITRKEFTALSPNDQMARVRDGFAVTD